ncbi:MAG: lipopolysaccharide heptosyltransferase II [Bryobacteraceae bacterium]
MKRPDPRNHPHFDRILIRATNWVGDAVMSLPALREVRRCFPKAEIAVLAMPWVADLYRRETFADRVILYQYRRGAKDLGPKWRLAQELRAMHFDCALLLPNSFESAALARAAGIPTRIGYARDGRRVLLTDPIDAPKKGSIPRFEAFYYLEMLRRLGWIAELPAPITIRLEGSGEAAQRGRDLLRDRGLAGAVIGLSPGAAFGGAKRWLPERFAETALTLSKKLKAAVAIFGTGGEKPLCQSVHGMLERDGVLCRNLAGATSLGEFIEMAAACRVFLTNDSGSMHIASALGVPTVAVFGATDHVATGPTGELSRVVREPVDCSPCLLRECPIDHRCMTRVTSGQVVKTALHLLK